MHVGLRVVVVARVVVVVVVAVGAAVGEEDEAWVSLGEGVSDVSGAGLVALAGTSSVAVGAEEEENVDDVDDDEDGGGDSAQEVEVASVTGVVVWVTGVVV